MRLQDFGINEPNVVAACQQLALTTCVYNNRRTLAEELIQPEGRVLLWKINENDWPPSYAVIESGERRFFLVVEGTTNIYQAVAQFRWAFMRQGFMDEAKTNGYWLQEAARILNEAESIIGQPQIGDKLHFTGHSYGGAIAMIAALWYARERHFPDCELATFGQPKGASAGLNVSDLACYWRYASSGDAAQGLPPNDIVNYESADWITPIIWEVTKNRWTHYGSEQLIYWNGNINHDPGVQYFLPEGVTNDPIQQHLLLNYYARFNQWNERFGTP